MPVAVVMVLYALGLLGCGAFAFFSAPPDAVKTTAIAIPGLYAVLAIGAGVLVALARSRPGMQRVGVILCMVLPLAFAALTSFPAVQRWQKMQNYPAAKAEFDAALAKDATLNEPTKRRAFFDQRDAPRFDQTFLVRTLVLIIALSLAAFVAVLICRGKSTAPTRAVP